MSSPEPQSNSYNAAAAHYERQQQQKESPTTAAQKIETIYTTVESEPDTDWLTVVSNIRQVNRQLVEEIARLEQALASNKQSLHTHKEQNQSHEITILQQQDDLKIAHERLSGIFQQLETSHQIGQRQQTLIETLSQQLEIVQTIIPQLEAEHDELSHKYQQQSQKLIKAEQVAVELHCRLQLQTNINKETPVETEQIIDRDSITDEDGKPFGIDALISAILDPETEIASADTEPCAAINLHPPDKSPLAAAISESNISLEIDPAPPRSSLQLPHREIPRWIPSPPTHPTETSSSASQPSTLRSWREEIAKNNLHHTDLDPISSLTPTSAETADKESMAVNDPLPNWPAPTLNRDLSSTKTTKIELPKFPKKSGG